MLVAQTAILIRLASFLACLAADDLAFPTPGHSSVYDIKRELESGASVGVCDFEEYCAQDICPCRGMRKKVPERSLLALFGLSLAFL